MLHFVALALRRGRAARHLFAEPRLKKKGKTPDRLTRGRRTRRRGRVHHQRGIVGKGRKGWGRGGDAGGAKCGMKAAISWLGFDQEAAADGALGRVTGIESDSRGGWEGMEMMREGERRRRDGFLSFFFRKRGRADGRRVMCDERLSGEIRGRGNVFSQEAAAQQHARGLQRQGGGRRGER